MNYNPRILTFIFCLLFFITLCFVPGKYNVTVSSPVQIDSKTINKNSYKYK